MLLTVVICWLSYLLSTSLKDIKLYKIIMIMYCWVCTTYRIIDIYIYNIYIYMYILCNFFCLLKKLREEREQVYIYRICYINLLIYPFQLFSIVPVDVSYYLVSFLYANATLLLPISFLLYYQMYYVSML